MMVKKTKKQLLKEARKELKGLDKKWSIDVRNRFNNKCVYCSNNKYINAHHIIPREIRRFRHYLDNGVALCARHHKFSFEFSAHKNPLIFFKFMSEHHPIQMRSLMEKYEKEVE